jgi:hypothetical protein
MKGRYTKFELHFKNTLLEPSETTLAATNIHHNNMIHIDVPETRSPDAPSLEAADAELEELCLIKVYRQHDQMLFSYWTPCRTTSTFASIIFKYWRHLFKTSSQQYIYDLVPWTGMTDQGDSHLSGTPHDHWVRLSGFLNRRHATGQLKNEKLCGSESPETLDDDNLYGVEDHRVASPLVLKIWLGGKPKSTKKSGKNLSRVSKVLFSVFQHFLI